MSVAFSPQTVSIRCTLRPAHRSWVTFTRPASHLEFAHVEGGQRRADATSCSGPVREPVVTDLLATIRALPADARERLLAELLREVGDEPPIGSRLQRELEERDRIERALVESQQQLAEANHLFQLVLDTIPVRVFWKDTRSRFLGANRRFAEDAGLSSPVEVVGKTDLDMRWSDQADLYQADDRRVLESLTPKINYDEPQDDGEGSLRWLRTSKFPLRSAGGEIIGVLGTYEDITEHKRLQDQLEQAQRLEAIGQLAGGVAHDFNNLLTGILGNAELLADAHETDPELRDCAQDIFQASRRAADLTQQLLAFSRKGRLQTVDVDLHELVRQTTKLLSHDADAKLEIRVDFRASSPVVHADPTQLSSALLNLALNARDAMPDGGRLGFTSRNRMLTQDDCVGFARGLKPGEYVELVVEDTGHGMAPEVLARIFEPFFTTKKPGGGTGLGLAAALGALQSHGGAILAESRPGAGSRFTVVLPVAKGSVRRPTPPALLPQGDVKGHVLVVDDEEVVRNLTARALRKFGYRVTTCVDGVDAVAYFQNYSSTVDLVLLDIVMPRQDGATTLKQLLDIDPEVPVLLASGFTREKTADALVALGAKGFLAKPFRLDELVREVAFHQRLR